MLLLKNNINTIFIMLGSNCNLNCKYCMQHSLINKMQSYNSDINIDIISFIKNQSQHQTQPIDVRFYGGEPLLYYKDIENIVSLLKDENVIFSIITNGKLLTEEIVDFFNTNNFVSCAISWDGKQVEKTRFYNVFKEKEDLLLKINNLNIDSVISAYNYLDDYIDSLIPYQEKFYKIHNKIFPFFEEIIVDAGNCFTDLIDFDYKTIQMKSNIIIQNILKAITKDITNYTIKDRLYLFLFTSLCHQLNGYNNFNYKKSYCGNGIQVLNIDLKGNLYQCHNNWIQIGSIYDDYLKYLNNANELNYMAEQNFINNHCVNCSILSLCRSGCPLISADIKNTTNFCKVRKLMFEPIINFVNDILLVNGDFNSLKGKYNIH